MSVFDGLPDVFTGVFGQTVTITPNGGSSRDITADFRRRSDEDPLDYGMVNSETYISAAAADVSDITEGDAVTVGSETFRTQAPMPDGRGMVKIRLSAT